MPLGFILGIPSQKVIEQLITNLILVGLLLLINQQKVLGIRWDTRSDNFKFEPSSIVEVAEEVGE